MADYDWGCDACGAGIVSASHFDPKSIFYCPEGRQREVPVQDPEQLAGHGYQKDTSDMRGMGPYNMYPPAYSGHVHQDTGHVHESSWTPGTAPRSTTAPQLPQRYPQYPQYEPIKVNDAYTCNGCGMTVWTTMGYHNCPGLSKPPGASGWACPVCGKGNAPFVRQCPCEGSRKGSLKDRVTNTTNEAHDRLEWHDFDCGGKYGDKPHFHNVEDPHA